MLQIRNASVTGPLDVRTIKAIRTEQVTLLYAHAELALGITFLNACIVTILQWNVIAIPIVLSWLAYMIVVIIARYRLVQRYWSTPPGDVLSTNWEARYLVGIAFAGVGWGSTAWLLFPSDSIGHQVFLAYALAGISAAAVPALSSVKGAFPLFVIPTLVPLTVRFFLERDDIHMGMAGMALLFTIGMLFLAHTTHRTIRETLRVRFENTQLIADLTAEKARVEKINGTLLVEIAQRRRAEEALRKAQP